MERTSLCNTTTWKITDTNVKNDLMQEIRTWWNQFECNIFPGPQPISIERKHLSLLRENPYWVCVKSDGLRYLFVCTTYKNKPYCYCINRRKDIYLLNFEIISDAFNGTILDGELIQNSESGVYEFMVYDSTIVCGTSTTQMPHSERIEQAMRVVDFIKYKPTETPFEVKLKIFYPVSDMKTYIDKVVPTIKHEIDGYVFTPENEPVKSGTHYTMFKWKERDRNTVDFWIEKHKHISRKYVMKISKGKSMHVMLDNVVHLPPEIEHKIQEKACVVECKYIGPNEWLAVLIRTDKIHPNNYLTWTKTLLNIEEDIQLEEFLFK